MVRGINVIAALLACATAASAVLAPFPHGKTTEYRYKAVVQTSTTEEPMFASLFAVRGSLNIEHDTRDPELVNAYNVVLSNVATDMFNGDTENHTETLVAMPSDSAARVIQEPFLIVYHANGTLQGVKFPEHEAEWSKNMKMAMASTLQLDLASMNVGKMTDKPDSFVSREKTIYGDCSVNYEVSPKKRVDAAAPEVFGVNKTFTPMKCDGFPLHEFNNVDLGPEEQIDEELMSTESSRLFEVQKEGEGVLIKKLDAYGMVSVLSANAASYPHFVITNMTFDLVQVKEKTAANTPLGNFAGAPIIRDVTYRCPEKRYAPGAAFDVTQGRRVVNQTDLIHAVNEMLLQAVDYLEENHVTPEGLDMDRARVINKMLRVMSLMDEESLGQISYRKETDLTRVEKIGTMFLGLVSQVGTTASCRYARKLIKSNLLPASNAVAMLAKLPLNVKEPTIELLAEMQDLATLSEPTHVEVRKAGILSFATLVYRTFKNAGHLEANPVLNGYLQGFADRVMSEPTVEMKVVYLNALRNVQVGKVADLLAPIVDGSVKISEDPERIRLLAIWAIGKSLEKNYATAVRVLWPVMENAALPTKVRLAAYEILMRQAPTTEDALRIHEYASSQGNRHFFNYHYTTLDSISKTVDKKHQNLRVIVYPIFLSTKYPTEGQEDLRYPLSSVESIRYVDDHAWYADKIDLGMIVNELTGLPEVVQFEHTTYDKTGPVSDIAVQVHIEGHQEIKGLYDLIMDRPLTQTAVRDLLDKAAKSLPALKGLQADVVVSHSGRVVVANHYDFDHLDNITTAAMQHFLVKDRSSINHQHLIVDRQYEKYVTSELGVPVVVEKRVPIVRSASLDTANMGSFPHDWDMTMGLKAWKHVDDSMSVYNPISDAWHSVRSASGAELSLPFSIRFVLHVDDNGQREDGITITFPKLPATISPVAGFVDSGEHLVTVDKIGAKALKESCPSCEHCVPIWDGSEEVNSRGPYREHSMEAVGLGLKLAVGSHRCQYGYLSERDLGYGPKWKINFDPHIPHTILESGLRMMWALRGTAHSQFLEAQMGSCGVMVKAEPSADHPISLIKFMPRGKYEDFDKNETNLEYIHADKWWMGVTFDTISAVTNSTLRLWKLDFETERNRGHLAKKHSLRMSSETPGEKKLKICVDAKKNYPVPPEDDLKLGTTKEETDSKMTIYYGLTDGDECVKDESVMTVTLKAELLDEQKKRLKHDLENSECSKDKKNPSFLVSKKMVPRTYNCINEAIRYTTPRKYSFDVTHEKLTPNFASYVYDRFTQRMEPQEAGSFKFNVEFPMDTNTVNSQWMTNTSDFVDTTTSLRTPLFDFYGPTLNPLWDFPMDNTRFSMEHLIAYTKNDMRICSVYPKVFMTGDGEYVPFAMPSDQWVLISGDHWKKEFAVFAKQPKPDQLSFLIFYRSEAIHFYTRESDNVFVAKADKEEKEIEQGFRLPTDMGFLWNIKILKQNNHFVVRIRYSMEEELPLLVGPNFITIPFDDGFQGHVSGLCGHLNGTHLNGAPQYLSVSEIAGY